MISLKVIHEKFKLKCCVMFETFLTFSNQNYLVIIQSRALLSCTNNINIYYFIFYVYKNFEIIKTVNKPCDSVYFYSLIQSM